MGTAVRAKQIVTLVLACVVGAPLLLGQSTANQEIKIVSEPYIPNENSAIRVQSTIVDMNVVVRDAKGQLVTGLKKEDFEIYDQGKKQIISSFDAELAHPPAMKMPESIEIQGRPPSPPPAVPPRFLAMYFDDENISTGDLVYARKAAESFVQKNMSETDRAGVFTSSTMVTQQFTSDKKQMLDTLAKIVSHQRSATFGATSCPRITPYEAMQINQSFDTHTDVFDMALAQAVQCNCSTAVTDSQAMATCVVEQSRLVQTQAATVLSLSEQFAQDSLGVLGDVIRYLGKMPGKRMLIMTSSGFFSRTDKVQHTQDKMIDAALHAGIVINTLDAKALAAEWVGGSPADGQVVLSPTTAAAAAGGKVVISTSGSVAGMNALQQRIVDDEREVSSDSMAVLASATGGKFFHNSNDLEGGLVELAALPEVSYAMSFSPDDVRANGVYHSLKVTMPGRRDVTISARPGYFAQSNEKGSPGAKLQKLNQEVMASDTLSGVAAEVTTQSAVTSTGETGLKVNVHVNGRTLAFRKENNTRAERIIFVTALFDMQGHYLSGVETVMDMNLKDATFATVSKDGVDARSTLQLPPGTYRLREVVQEVVGGRLAASSQTVEVR
nr:VWA domain-containing protein [Candidatus Acidoferrales bacterium]